MDHYPDSANNKASQNDDAQQVVELENQIKEIGEEHIPRSIKEESEAKASTASSTSQHKDEEPQEEHEISSQGESSVAEGPIYYRKDANWNPNNKKMLNSYQLEWFFYISKGILWYEQFDFTNKQRLLEGELKFPKLIPPFEKNPTVIPHPKGRVFLHIADRLNFFEFDTTTFKVEIAGSMRYLRRGHRFVIARDNYIYCLGDQKNKICEYYDLENDSWHKAGNLQKVRTHPTAFVSESSTIFAVGGYHNCENARINLYSRTFEKVHLAEGMKENWCHIRVRNFDHIPGRISMGVISIDENNFLLFGGKRVTNNKLYDDNYIFNCSSLTIEKAFFYLHEKTAYNSAFMRTKRFINEVYPLGIKPVFKELYDLKTNKWTLFEEIDWEDSTEEDTKICI